MTAASAPTVAELVALLDHHYDPAGAADWDAVGLVCGDPAAPVSRVHLAVDPVSAVVDEALEAGAHLLVVHHPLLLRGVHGVAADTAKGRLVHRLVTGGCALFTAHTNADVARPGVSDALADRVGLRATAPLQPSAGPAMDKLVAFAPPDAVPALLDALAGAGAGTIGDYRRCAWTAAGTGTFRPVAGATPAVGAVGRTEVVDELRLEMVLPRRARPDVVAALRAAHPYEEPAFDLYELAATPAGGAGLGRVGELDRPRPLAELTRLVAERLPATAWGVRAAGDPRRPVRVLAVCGGAGGELAAAAAAAGADALLTADLRHHPASELVEAGGPALLDAAHWATEWAWLPAAAEVVRAGCGGSVTVTVSTIVSDPWTVCERPTGPAAGPRP